MTAGTSQGSPEWLRVKATLGIVERITAYFPPGCHGFVHAAFFHREHQFLPDHPTETISGDDLLFDMALDYEIAGRPANIDILTWNEDGTNPHTIQVQIFIREGVGEGVADQLRRVFGLTG